MHVLRTQISCHSLFAVAVEFTMAPSALPQCIVSGVRFVAQFCENLAAKTAEAKSCEENFLQKFCIFPSANCCEKFGFAIYLAAHPAVTSH
jgi:hypothetical protein